MILTPIKRTTYLVNTLLFEDIGNANFMDKFETEIVAFLIDPPNKFVRNCVRIDDFQIYGSILLYSLWNWRNKAKSVGEAPHITSFLDAINKLQREHSNSTQDQGLNIEQAQAGLTSPQIIQDHLDRGETAIFHDAAFFTGKTCWARWAMNAESHPLAWHQRGTTSSAAQAEAEATLLPTTVAKEMNWSKI